MAQTMDIDEVPFSKLQIGQYDQKEEPLEVMDSLVPTTTDDRNIKGYD